MSEEVKATPELTPQDELRQAQEKVAAAKAKLEAADKLRLQALQVKLAAIQAEKDRIAAEQRAEAERIEQEHIARKNLEREQEAKKQREEAQRIALINAEIAKAEAAQQEQQQREAQLQQLAEEAAALEIAAQAATAEALRSLEFIEAGVATKEVTPSATEDSTGERHPLRRFQHRTDIYATDAPAPATDGISSEQTSLAQMKIDAIENESHPVYAQKPAPVPVTPASQSARRPKSEAYVDASVAREIEELLRKELKLSLNPMRIDSLTATWQQAPLVSAFRTAIARFKAVPMSTDGLLVYVEQLLEGMDSSEPKTQAQN